MCILCYTVILELNIKTLRLKCCLFFSELILYWNAGVRGIIVLFFQKLSCEWKKDENKLLVGVIALIFIQCFDTDLVIGRVSGPQISAIYTVKFLYWSHSLSPPSVKARLVFTARCYASAVLAMALCLSVCLYPSQVGVLLKRLNVGSHKQHHTIVQGL